MSKKATKKSTKKVVKKAAKKVAKKIVKKSPKKAPVKKAAKKTVKKAASKGNGGLSKPYTPSAALAEITGKNALPRTEVIRKIWVYIKANKLQDPKNKRMINADAKLKPIFSGKGQVSMFEMNVHLSKHLK